MALHAYLFLLVVFLILTLALLWRLDCSIFSLSIQEEGPSTPQPSASSSNAPLLTAPPVVSPALPRRVEGQCLLLCDLGARSKAAGEPPGA